MEKANRLWSVRGKKPEDIPKKLKSKEVKAPTDDDVSSTDNVALKHDYGHTATMVRPVLFDPFCNVFLLFLSLEMHCMWWKCLLMRM